jgi:hypothetical protein
VPWGDENGHEGRGRLPPPSLPPSLPYPLGLQLRLHLHLNPHPQPESITSNPLLPLTLTSFTSASNLALHGRYYYAPPLIYIHGIHKASARVRAPRDVKTAPSTPARKGRVEGAFFALKLSLHLG